MIIRCAVLIAVITGAFGSIALAQSAAEPPQPSQSMQEMAKAQGVASNPPADMKKMMTRCVQMNAQMKTGMKMTPDMQPMMDRCNGLDQRMGATRAPDDTLSR